MLAGAEEQKSKRKRVYFPGRDMREEGEERREKKNMHTCTTREKEVHTTCTTILLHLHY
jgi:hypothetical protein